MIVEVCEADAVTPTKRLYPRSVLQANLDRLRETIENGAFMGELGPVSDSIIHLNNVSHCIDGLWFDDNKLMAHVRVLETPPGWSLATLMRKQKCVEFKMVGVGQGRVNDNGILVISDSYKLIQIEAVAPDFPGLPHMKNITKRTQYRSIDEPWYIGSLLEG